MEDCTVSIPGFHLIWTSPLSNFDSFLLSKILFYDILMSVYSHTSYIRVLCSYLLHFRMARPCKFCGSFFQDSEELELHENLHRDLDYLNGNVIVDF